MTLGVMTIDVIIVRTDDLANSYPGWFESASFCANGTSWCASTLHPSDGKRMAIQLGHSLPVHQYVVQFVTATCVYWFLVSLIFVIVLFDAALSSLLFVEVAIRFTSAARVRPVLVC